MKQCTKCASLKDKSEFYAKESRCKPCVNDIRREKYSKNPKEIIDRVARYRANNPEKIRDTKLKQAYGVGTEYFNAKLKEQGGVCAGCGQNRKVKWRNKEVEMSLDHDHLTGTPRGVLCIKCNRGLGLLEENSNTFQNLINYVAKYKKTG
jgi:hypothetical protein